MGGVDGRVSNLNPQVMQALQRVQKEPGQALSKADIREITAAVYADHQVDAAEADLMAELFNNQTEIVFDREGADFEPITMHFETAQGDHEGRLEFHNAILVSEDKRMAPTTATAPSDWGDVGIQERRDQIQKLGIMARKLHAQGIDGPQLWRAVREAAVNNYDGKTLDAQRKSDFVMQDTALALLGSSALAHLNSYDNKVHDYFQDPLVNQFQQDYATLGIDAKTNHYTYGYAGKDGWAVQTGEEKSWFTGKSKPVYDHFWSPGLDDTNGSAFRPEINDRTDNQIFHTFFYEYMGYVTGSALAVEAGSLMHEVKDHGQTSEDHNASYVGFTVGNHLRSLRDQGGAAADAALKQWPAMTEAAYAREGGKEIIAGTASPEAQAMHQLVVDKLNSFNPIWSAENAFIDFWSDDKPMIGPWGAIIDTDNW